MPQQCSALQLRGAHIFLHLMRCVVGVVRVSGFVVEYIAAIASFPADEFARRSARCVLMLVTSDA